MKKSIFSLAIAAALVSCSQGGLKINGSVATATAGDSIKLMLPVADGAPEMLAGTVANEDGSFTLTSDNTTPAMAVVVTQSGEARPQMLAQVILESGNIAIAKDSLDLVTVSGSPLNDKLSALSAETDKISMEFRALPAEATDEEREAVYGKYESLISTTIDENIDNYVGAYLFAESEYHTLDFAEAQARLDSFSEELRQTDILKNVAEQLELAAKTAVGQNYINIVPADNSMPLAMVVESNKYTLLDFWATWCGPCMGEMPHLLAAHEEFSSKGFQIYGVSLDRDKEAWSAYVVENLNWVNVLNGEEGEANGADLYGVQSIPTNFLIDSEGKIVAKNLRGDDLEAKLTELLK